MLDGWTSAGSNGSMPSVARLEFGDEVAVGEQHLGSLHTFCAP